MILFIINITSSLYSLTRQTRNSAKGKGNKNPDKMLRKIDPGIANVCKLYIAVKESCQHCCIVCFNYFEVKKQSSSTVLN